MDINIRQRLTCRSLLVTRTLLLVAFTTTVPSVHAVDRVTITRNDKPLHLEGKLVVEAEDGGVLMIDRDGTLWAAQPDEISNRESDDKPFVPFSKDEVKASLGKQLGAEFRFHETAHYIIAYNTSNAYAHWCGALYERLYLAFHNYWKNRGIKLHAPELPMIALVFDDKASYGDYARAELGDATSVAIGYYSLRTNRVAMYDLTRADKLASANSRVSSASHVNRILSQPAAERTVATIIHEATHQLAYNCGVHERYANIPLWVSEGMAMYFETPDLKSTSGWRGIGRINQVRLAGFRHYLKTRPSDSLLTMLSDDGRLRRARTAGAAYGESWALNYYLIKRHKAAYTQYIKTLTAKKPLLSYSPAERVAEFQAAFGEDLQALDKDFVRYMSRLR